MYCRNCGKEIDYVAPICKECEEKERLLRGLAASKAQAEKPAQTGDRKEGFSKALASTIIGAVAFFISMVVMVMLLAAAEEFQYYDVSGITTTCTVLSVLTLGGSIPALIFGIKSIKCFINAKNEGRIKPIPTLVCGIVGVVLSGLTILYSLLAFVLCAAMGV